MNPRLNARDRGLIKGAVRRAFARSELRRSVLQDAKITHSDPSRPRVKTWYKCAHCEKPFAQHQLEVDHKSPVVPTHTTLEKMSWDDLINNTWCDKIGLQVLCETCHDLKSANERKLRKEAKCQTKLKS
jgi:5-methylcytosine-specific restriction endonuclease McrA